MWREIKTGRLFTNKIKMKVQGLQAGNWIEKDGKQYRATPMTIFCLGDNHNPILLTEEWHKKFGVEKSGFNSFTYQISNTKQIDFHGDYVFIRDISDITTFKPSMNDDICILWNNDFRKRGMYVHEWQNLYYLLTLKELTIK